MFEDKPGSSHTFEEYKLFNELAKYSNLSALILEYSDIISEGAEGALIWIMDEYNQNSPAETYAFLALANKNIR